MDLLILLVERRGQLVSRSDIVDRLWGKDVFVDVETGVNTAIRKIRQALRRFAGGAGVRRDGPGQGVSVHRGRRGRSCAGPQPASQLDPAAVGAGQSQRPPTRTRHRTPGEPRSGSPRVGLSAVAVVAGLSSTWAWLGGAGPSHGDVAVLPFENLSGDADREYLADGLAEETIASLGQVDPEHVNVIGRTSIMVYKRTTKSLAEIGRELGADYLVESSIRAEGQRLRITSKLIRAHDQLQVWSASYDREPISILGLQRELSTAIAEQIRLRLSPDRLSGLGRRQTQNADAYDAISGDSISQTAVTRSPTSSPSNTTSARPRSIRTTPLPGPRWPSPSGEHDQRRCAAARCVGLARGKPPRTAVRAEPDLSEAQSSLGYVISSSTGTGPRRKRRSGRRSPSIPATRRRIDAGARPLASRPASEAEPAMRRARELEPLDAMSHALSAQVAFQARDYRSAVEHARQAILVDPEFWIGYMQLGQAYEQLGRDRSRAGSAHGRRAVLGRQQQDDLAPGPPSGKAGRPARPAKC